MAKNSHQENMTMKIVMADQIVIKISTIEINQWDEESIIQEK